MSLALDITGTAAPRTTEKYGYVLPSNNGRFEVNRNTYGQYKLPHPLTGEPGTFSRMSTIAKMLDDTYNLDRWHERNIVVGLVSDPMLAVEAGNLVANPTVNAKRDMNDIVERAELASGAGRAAEFGTAVHEWCEVVDRGEVTLAQVPEMYRPHVEAYLARLAIHGLFAIPQYCERIVFFEMNGIPIVGTLDRIYALPTGDLVLGDLKTSATLEWSYLSYAMQLAGYQGASHMLSADGTRWEPMPALRDDYAVLAHLPSGDASAAAIVTFDLAKGRTGLDLATRVRDLRKGVKKSIPYVHALPTPSASQVAWHRARVALISSRTVDDVSNVWSSYREVWDDTLTAIGKHVVALNESETPK